MRRLLSVFVICAMLLTQVGFPEIIMAVDGESGISDTAIYVTPGTTLADAAVIQIGVKYSGKHTYEKSLITDNVVDNKQYFKFSTTKQGIVNFKFKRTKVSGGEYTIFFNALSDVDVKKGEVTGLKSYSGTYMYNIDGSAQAEVSGYNIGLPAGTYSVAIVLSKTTITEKNESIAQNTFEFTVEHEETEDWEIESNDTSSTATVINRSGKKYYGNIYKYDRQLTGGSSDKDYFLYKTTEKGGLSVRLEHGNVSGGESETAFTVKVIEATSNRELLNKSLKGGELSGTTCKVGLPKDSLYYIEVSGSEKSVGAEYSIKVNFVKSENWEQEGNDSIDYATDVIGNTDLKGTILSSSDLDYYKVKIDGSGSLKITLKHDVILGCETRNCFSMEVYAKGNLVTPIASITGIKGSQTCVSLPELSVKAGSIYYIKVKGNSYSKLNYYTISIKPKVSKYFEREDNNVYTKANTIKTGKVYYGCLQTDKDVDFYKISLKKKGYIKIAIFQNSNSAKKIYTLIVSDANNRTIYETDIIGLNKTYDMAKLGLEKGDYYISLKCASSEYYYGTYSIKVSEKANSNWESENNGDYALADSIKVDKAIGGTTLGNEKGTAVDDRYDYFKFTLAKATYINVSVVHKKINGADALWSVNIYDAREKLVSDSQFQIKQSKSYMESNILKLAAGTYYVKVYAYDEAVDLEYSLCVNKVSAKAPETIKAVKSGGKVKLNWSVVPGGLSYKIYRSSSMNGKYVEVKTLKGVATTSWTDKVSSKKNYFYKMKTTVKVGKIKTSGYSKAIKTSNK